MMFYMLKSLTNKSLFFFCCSYLNYSSICARLVRRCLKPELRVEALKREDSLMKSVKWEGGKQAGQAS